MSDRICETLGKHAAALREIQQLLDGKVWRLKDLHKAAHILEKAGYAVRSVGGSRPYTLPADHHAKYRDGNKFNECSEHSKG